MAQNGPRWPKLATRWLQVGPRWSQDGPKLAQDRPKLAPRGLKGFPRRAQDSPRGFRDGPGWAQDGTERPPRGPKMSSRWAKTAQERFKLAQDGPRRFPEGPKTAQEGVMLGRLEAIFFTSALPVPMLGQVSVSWGGFSGLKWCSRRGQTLTLRKSGALVEVKRSISYFGELRVSKVVLPSRRNARFHFSGFS